MNVQSVEKRCMRLSRVIAEKTLWLKHFAETAEKHVWVGHFAKNLQNVYYLSVLSENMLLFACMCDKGL